MLEDFDHLETVVEMETPVIEVIGMGPMDGMVFLTFNRAYFKSLLQEHPDRGVILDKRRAVMFLHIVFRAS